MPKLSDAQVAEIRSLLSEGVSRSELAQRFGVSVQHVGRLARGDSRPFIGGLDAALVEAGDVALAVERYVDGLELDAEREVLAELARVLAAQLDACGRSGSASAASAMPAVARQLVDVVALLQAGEPLPDDPLTLIRRRREARLLAIAAGGEWRGD